MSFYLGQLEDEIYHRLQPLQETLAESEIPLACLPKEAGKYNQEVQGLISILIPAVNQVEVFNKVSSTQLVELTIIINLSLPNRYQESEKEKDVLEFCAQQITGLLLGFKPAIATVRREMNFRQYTLFRPEGRFWEAQLEFTLQLDIRAIQPDSSIIKEQLKKVELFASDSINSTKIKEYVGS